jgi:hypothetical protein
MRASNLAIAHDRAREFPREQAAPGAAAGSFSISFQRVVATKPIWHGNGTTRQTRIASGTACQISRSILPCCATEGSRKLRLAPALKPAPTSSSRSRKWPCATQLKARWALRDSLPGCMSSFMGRAPGRKAILKNLRHRFLLNCPAQSGLFLR